MGDVAETCRAGPMFKHRALFGFTVETHAGEGAIVGPKMRLCDSAGFVGAAIAAAGLTCWNLSRVIPHENRNPVPGLLALARR